jgi:hypothetical protein
MPARLLTSLAFVLAAAGAFAAGSPEPVANFQDLPVRTQGDTPSAAQVRAAILSAGGKRHWMMVDGEPGKLVATLLVRGKHKAVVDISYSPQSFSIVYRDSENLNYDGHQIHNAYNRWVKDLVFSISSTLSLVQGNPSAIAANPPLRPAPVPAVASAPPPGGARNVEVAFWECVRDTKNPVELQAYLDQYPNGVFASLARTRLAALRSAAR